MSAHYDGIAAEAFWQRVELLPEPDRRAVCALANALQDLERRTLRALELAELSPVESQVAAGLRNAVAARRAS